VPPRPVESAPGKNKNRAQHASLTKQASRTKSSSAVRCRSGALHVRCHRCHETRKSSSGGRLFGAIRQRIPAARSFYERARCFSYLIGNSRLRRDKLRRKPRKQTDQIVRNQDLSVAM